MIRRLIALALLLGAAPAAAQTPIRDGFAVAPDVSLRVWLPTGRVRLSTWDKDSVHVTGVAGKGALWFGGGRGSHAKLGVELRDRMSGKLAYGELDIIVPARAHLWIKMTSGDVSVQGTRGELEVVTVAGRVDVRDARGVVAVDAIDAPVTLTNVDGATRVNAGSGLVTLRAVRGTLTVTTVGGGVDLAGDSLPDARLETIGGAVTLRGALAATALVEISTHDGAIVLAPPRDGAPALELSSRGAIVNPLKPPRTPTGRIVARSFKGTINVQPVAGIGKGKP